MLVTFIFTKRNGERSVTLDTSELDTWRDGGMELSEHPKITFERDLGFFYNYPDAACHCLYVNGSL